MDGDINFRNARFQYPTRPEVNVLRELNLSLTKGQKVALVGPSGCGKSTCIQLLQRFYDLKGGDAVSYIIYKGLRGGVNVNIQLYNKCFESNKLKNYYYSV